MSLHEAISQQERAHLRELAREVLECAHLPVMEERRRRWLAHNALRGDRPMIVMEEASFLDDLLPERQCPSEAGWRIERYLQSQLVNVRLVDDDKVVPAEFPVYWHIETPGYGVSTERSFAADAEGRRIGFSQEHPIACLETDMEKLRHLPFRVDRAASLAERDLVGEVLGDILPVRMNNDSLRWHMAPSARMVELMGLENMMIAMAEEPEGVEALYRFLADDMEAFLRWQESENLLFLNNGNDYVGAGSYGFTDELPMPGRSPDAALTGKDLWGNLNSQETVSISPTMFHELVYPHYERLASLFGLVYFGCCEPVHAIWDRSISRLPNLRKVSISAWCDEMFMGERLRGSRVIYSRKPSPNFIGVGKTLDEEAFSRHIAATLEAARGCKMEIIFRDIYTLSGVRTKAGQAVRIVRKLVDQMW